MYLDLAIIGCLVMTQKLSKSKSFLAVFVIDQISASAFSVFPVTAKVMVVELEVRHQCLGPITTSVDSEN